MANRISRLVFLPVAVGIAYSVVGVLFLKWSVADLYFWFWAEFVMVGVIAVALVQILLRHTAEPVARYAGVLRFSVPFSFLLLLFYATLFAAMAFKGEWKTWDRFPEFLRDKWVGLTATVIAQLICFVACLLDRNQREGACNDVLRQFSRKTLVVAALYILMLLHGWIREWTTGDQLALSDAYMKAMGLVLIALKVPVEAGLLDRWFNRRRPKQQ